MSSLPDSSATTSTTVQHATFVDERPGVSDPLLPTPAVQPTSVLTAPDLKMTAENLLQNPIQIASGDWTTVQPRGAIINALDLPAAFGTIPSFQTAMLGVFAFFKCNLILTIKLNSTRFHQGSLWAFVDPMQQMLDTAPAATNSSKYVNVYSASSQPRVELDAAQSNSAILRIPFVHVQDRLTTNSRETWDVMAKVRLMVASPLKAAVGSNGTVSYQIFIHAEDVSLDDPIYPHASIIPSFHTPIAALQHGFESAITNTVTGIVGCAANALTGNYGKAVTSASKGLEGIGEAMTMFNLDKPADPTAATINSMSPFGPLSHGTASLDCSVRLGNAPLGAYLETRYASGETKDMDLYARAQIPGLVSIIPWTVDDLPGSVLLTIPVLPSYTNTELLPVIPGEAPGYTRIYNTNLSYIAEMFIYWRMSMVYALKAYSSQFHSGRLLLTFTPNQRSTVPANLSEYTNLPAVYFDIQGNTLSTVVVPFHSSLTRKTWAPWATIPSRNQYTDQHILGYLDIVVFNRLVAPSNVSPNVELFLFQSAHNDVEFESPRLLSSSKFRVPFAVAPALLAPSHHDDDSDSDYASSYDVPDDYPRRPISALMHSDSEDLTSRKNAPPEFLSKAPRPAVRMNVFNEGVRDIRELTRRYTPIRFYQEPMIDAVDHLGTGYTPPGMSLFYQRSVVPVSPYLHSGTYFNTPVDDSPTNTESLDAASYHNRAARLNVFFHGGMRYKVVPISNRLMQNIASVTYVPDQDILPPVTPTDTLSILSHVWAYSTHITNYSQNAALQIETPFMSGYNQVVTETVVPPDTFPPDVTHAGSIHILNFTDNIANYPTAKFDSVVGPAISYVLFSATADDAVFHYAVAPPVTYSNQNLRTPPV